MTIGLTGKSCSGKNFVASLLQDIDCEIMDLDNECHALYESEHDRIIEEFGTADRQKLSLVVFSDREKLEKLQSILYPALIQKIKEKQTNSKKLLVVNGALIHRAGIDCMCDAVIYVDAPYSTRQKRAFLRNGTSEKMFRMREESQSDVDFRTVPYRCPVYVLVNNGELDLKERTAKTLLSIITSLGQGRSDNPRQAF